MPDTLHCTLEEREAKLREATARRLRMDEEKMKDAIEFLVASEHSLQELEKIAEDRSASYVSSKAAKWIYSKKIGLDYNMRHDANLRI